MTVYFNSEEIKADQIEEILISTQQKLILVHLKDRRKVVEHFETKEKMLETVSIIMLKLKEVP